MTAIITAAWRRRPMNHFEGSPYWFPNKNVHWSSWTEGWLSRLVWLQGFHNEFKPEVPLLPVNMNDSFDGEYGVRKRSRSDAGWQHAFHGTVCNGLCRQRLESVVRVLRSLFRHHSTMTLPLIIFGLLFSNRPIKPDYFCIPHILSPFEFCWSPSP